MKLKSRIMMVLVGGVIGMALLAGLPTIARADLITFDFSGTVASVDPALAPTFSTGQTLTGSYTFDSTVPATPTSTSATSVFDALTAINFSIGSYSASSTASPEIQIDSFAGSGGTLTDRYAVVSRASEGLTGADVNGDPLNFFSFRMDATSGVFSTALTLPTSLSLSDFASSAFFVFFTNPADSTNPFIVSGTLTGFSQPAAAPLPGAFLLFGSGLAGLSMFRLKKKS